MFHDIGEKVGQYLNNANWTNTVDHFGKITNRGSGPYSSLHTGKYSADDNWRLQAYDSTIGARATGRRSRRSRTSPASRPGLK